MSRLCLYLPDHPTPREIERVRSVARALEGQITCLIGGSSNSEPPISDGLPEDLKVPKFPAAAIHTRKSEIEALDLDAVISLAESPADGPQPPIAARYGAWTFVEGDPRRYSGPHALTRAIAEGSSYVGITLKRWQAPELEWTVLAFVDVRRRPWDDLTALRRRLDLYLPLMIEEALERVNNDRCLFIKPPEQEPDTVWLHRFNLLKQRTTDVKYLVHLALAPFARLFYNGKTNIILFHNPVPDVLDDLLAQLSKLGPFVRYSQVIEEFRERRTLTPGFVITFDDGYKHNMAVLDVLDRHGCKAMFFVNTASVDQDCPLWFMNKDTNFLSWKADLKTMAYQPFLETIDRVGLTKPSPLRGRFGLKSEEIRTLAARGHEVGVHTHNHPFLSQLRDDEIQYEVSECFNRLRNILRDDSLPLHIAYPDGDYDEKVMAVFNKMGARSAVTLHPGPLNDATDFLELPRYGLADVDYPGFALFKLTEAYAMLKGYRG
ncbi:MAG: polysaccharide deacetylase family protein [Acidiferrobacterales bacterium]